MSIWIDPVTRQRVVFHKSCGDIQYNLEGDTAISKETVPVVGPWTDNIPGNSGSDSNVNSRTQQMFAGRTNKLFGKDPGVQGEKLPVLNEVGQRAQTTRRRIHRRMVEVKDGKHKII